jgi:small subunit ribosomal protein S8
MRHDLLADVFAVIKNSENLGKKECVTPASGLIGGVLEAIRKNEYIGEFERVEDGKGGQFRITLVGRVNGCNVIRPRFSVGLDETIKWEKKFLPSDRVGILILTTSKGVMDQREAVRQKVGGKLLGYVY